MLSKKSLIFIPTILSLTGCATFSTDFDRDIGAENSQVVSQQMGLYQPTEMRAYVKAVGQRLVDQIENSEFEYQFEIVDDPSPNAFALPGGYIYISRGLLVLMESEDELACVLGHEIIHVDDRHSVKQMRSGILPGIISIPGNIVGIVSTDLGNIINAPINFSNHLFMANYSRGNETDSDSKGIKLAAKAGYDPDAMAGILDRLNSAVEYQTKKKTEKSYFDSHPYTPDRVANIDKIAPTLIKTKEPHIVKNFPMPIDGLVYGPNPIKGTFIENQFFHPEIGFAMDFPKDWEYINQPQAVVAYNEKQKSFIALSMGDQNHTALEHAQDFQRSVKKQYGKEVEYKEVTFTFGGTGYATNIKTKVEKVDYTIALQWVEVNKDVYQITSVTPLSMEKEMLASTRSLRQVSQAERNLITQDVVKIIRAKKGQSITDITKQNHSVVSAEYTLLINDIDKNQSLKKGEMIKVITKEKYISKK